MAAFVHALRMMTAGAPGSHLGVAHVVKHYLNPGEYWDDLADPLLPDRPEVWPEAIATELQALGVARPHEQVPSLPSDAVVAGWEMLADAMTRGYGAVIDAAFGAAFGAASCAASSRNSEIFSRPESATVASSRQAAGVAGGRVALLLPGGIIVIGDAVSAPSTASNPSSSHSPTPIVLHMRTAYRPTLTPTARFGQGPRDAANRAIRRGLSELKAQARMLALTAGDNDE